MHDYKKELEDFAYTVSHDLNAPMRHIKSFGDLLVRRLDEKVNDEERQFLNYIENNIGKLENMLAALLEYSRLNTEQGMQTPFDCDAMVRVIIAQYDEKIKDANGTVSVSGLPTNLVGNKKQISLLFTHLIDNAIKFRHKEKPLLLNISGEKAKEHWLFSIKDNGIGIPDSMIKNVFGIFKRAHMHIEAEYPGTGAGLTIAQKIVENHNGKIIIDSNDSGTAVFVTLPQTHY